MTIINLIFRNCFINGEKYFAIYVDDDLNQLLNKETHSRKEAIAKFKTIVSEFSAKPNTKIKVTYIETKKK